MSTPLWQFWTDWAVKALGALFTVLAVIVALFGLRLRHWITPPQLSIELSSAEGWPGVVVMDSCQISGFWYHVRVFNKTRETPITGVYVLLQLIEDEEVRETSGELKRVWEGSAALRWSFESENPLPKTIGYRDAECVLCHILKEEPLAVLLSPIIKGQAPDRLLLPFKFIFTLQAKGVEAQSSPRRLRVHWNGKWSDDRDEMKHHLGVEPV